MALPPTWGGFQKGPILLTPVDSLPAQAQLDEGLAALSAVAICYQSLCLRPKAAAQEHAGPPIAPLAKQHDELVRRLILIETLSAL